VNLVVVLVSFHPQHPQQFIDLLAEAAPDVARGQLVLAGRRDERRIR